MIQIIYLNVEKGYAPKVRFIENELETFYSLINCEYVEMYKRNINGKDFTIICDENGALKEKPIISAISHKGYTMFCGNLIIAGMPNEDGNLTNLSDKDVMLINSKFRKVIKKVGKGFKSHYILYCEY